MRVIGVVYLIMILLVFMERRNKNLLKILTHAVMYTASALFLILLVLDLILLGIALFYIGKIGKNSGSTENKRFQDEKER
jgi:hypothetical protein